MSSDIHYSSQSGRRTVKTVKQAAVQVVVSHDVDAISIQKRDATTGNSMYPRNGSGVYDIQDGEPLYENLSIPRDNSNSSPAVLSSLNGLGRDAKAAYPNDPAMQRLVLKNKIRPRGFAVGTVHEGDHPVNAIAATIGGTTNPWFDEDIPSNSLVALDLPKQEEAFSPMNFNEDRGITKEKALLKLVRHDPRMITVDFAKHVRAVLEDEKKYNDAFGSEDGSDNSLPTLLAVKDLFESQLMTMLLGIETFIELVGALENKKSTAEERVEFKKRLSTIAVGLGIVQNTPGSGITITATEQAKYDEYKKVFFDKVNWDGNQQTKIFQTYGSDIIDREGFLKDGSGHINRKSIAGQLVEKQHNHWRKSIQSYNLFVHDASKWIVGKTTDKGISRNRGTILTYF